MKKEKIDLTGKRFGKWLAINPAPKRGKIYFWNCQCDCGICREVSGSALRHNESLSCGCDKAEKMKAAITTHGKSRAGVYSSWNSMMGRCYNESHTHFNFYGAAGVSVCSEWQSFEGFFADMGDRPEGCTIDRIDNNLGYQRGNCRWATKKEQANNRRNSKPIECFGLSMNVRDWSKATGIPWQTIDGRLRRGWTAEKAVTPKQLKPTNSF